MPNINNYKKLIRLYYTLINDFIDDANDITKKKITKIYINNKKVYQ